MSTEYQPDVEKAQTTNEKAGNTVTLHGLDEGAADGTVHRNLKARHLQMIAIGGAIGTGLFVGAGGALATGGPLGIWLGYTIMGCIVYSMMIALGEMATLYPVSGAFVHYTARFMDPAFGFAVGWNYWYSYAITLPTEIVAAALVIDYWPGAQGISPAAWISIFIVVICSFNFFGVRAYGEAEFWFSLTKCTTVIGLLILGLIITCGGGPNHQTIGFRFWRADGPFQQLNGIPGSKGRFLAFWATLTQAAFSYLGTEIVALTAGEAANPRRNVPKAIKRVFYRILLFYVIGTLLMGMLVSPNNENLLNGSGVAASPWVIAIETAGIKVLPSIINSVVIISAFSAGNSDLYASSRTLYGLACDGKAPAVFRKCTKGGIPIWCVCLTACFGPLAYMTVSSGASNAFNYLSDLSSVTGLITWACILGAYLRFYYGCKAQGIDRSTFPYQAPGQPYLSWIGLIMLIIIIFFCGFENFLTDNWDTGSFLTDYIPVWVFIIFVVFWKFYKRTKWVSLSAIDFETGRRELDDMAEAEAEKEQMPTTWYGKLWAAIM
ncbi:amino acid transmembrane transporter [Pseudohyphozyma bogoriensis]|nr:amino acid transmembrane transporter [Pseudohyphozyma bogoriensis]